MRKRLIETPGYVTSWEKDEVQASLVIERKFNTPKLSAEALGIMQNTAQLWEDPNGDRITHAVALWRILRQMSLGFWYRWDPKPPKEWMQARQEWAAFEADRLKNNRSGLDTPLQVWNDVERTKAKLEKELKNCKNEKQRAKVRTKMEHAGVYVFERWDRIKPTFKINTVCEWIDETAVNEVLKWRDKHPKHGLVWVEFIEFGRRLHREGLTYFGGGDKSNVALLTHRGTCAVSIKAHREGKNLQDRFYQNLYPTFPTSDQDAEQSLGRTHRKGQMADEVTAEVWLPTRTLREAFESTRAAAAVYEQTRHVRQKLNHCDVV